MSDDEYIEENYFSDEDYYMNDDDNEYITDVVGYDHQAHISFTHELLNGYSPLSEFAEKISISIRNITDYEDDTFKDLLNNILNFINNNSEQINPIYYKNPDMFVLGYLCTDNKLSINKQKLKNYSENYNINDIIRYSTFIQKII